MNQSSDEKFLVRESPHVRIELHPGCTTREVEQAAAWLQGVLDQQGEEQPPVLILVPGGIP